MSSPRRDRKRFWARGAVPHAGRGRRRAGLQHAPARRGERTGPLTGVVPVHARRRVRGSAAGLGRAVDAAGAGGARPVRRHAVRAGRRDVGARGRRGLRARGPARHGGRAARVRAQRARGRQGPGARPRVLLPLRGRRRAQPTGRTRTAPATGNGALRFAFVSCQNWEAGYYTPYKHLVDEDVDVVLHLGDYIYEGVPTGTRAARPSRRRPGRSSPASTSTGSATRLYKADPDLQAAHAAAAFVATWDDHESSTTTRTRRPRATPEATFLSAAPTPIGRTGRTCRCGSRSSPQGPTCSSTGASASGASSSSTSSTPASTAARSVAPAITDRSPTPARHGSFGAEQEQWLLDGTRASPARWNVLAQQVLMAH